MISLVSVRRLQAFNTQRERQCERGLDKAIRELAPLDHELSEIEQQVQSMTDLLISHRAENQRLSQAQLFGHLRHQAVIRRQINQLVLDKVRVTTQHTEVAAGIERLHQHRKVLQIKQLKLERLEQRALLERRSRQWRCEENEIEELMVNLR